MKKKLIDILIKRNLTPAEKKEISDVISGDLSQDESDRLMEEFWERLGGSDEISKDFNPHMNIERLHRQLGLSAVIGTIPAAKKQNHSRRLLRVAAVLIPFLLLGGAGYYLLTENSAKVVTISSQKGQRKQVQLPDGTEVWLNSGSSISYSEGYGKDRRQLKLEGEAYFDVRKDSRHPFVLEASDITIRVLGTRFNVLAYPEDKLIEATLEAGQIEYSDPYNKAVKLIPGQQLRYASDSKKLTLLEVETEKFSSWRKNQLVFRNDSLSYVLNRMEHWYGCHFIVQDSSLLGLHFTATIQQESLEEVMALLSESVDLQFSSRGDIYTLKASGK